MCVNRVTIRVSLIIVIVRTGPISFNSRYNRSQSNISHRNNCGNGFQPDHREKLSAYTIIKYKEYLSNETIFNFQRTNERNLICEAFGVAFAGDHAFALGAGETTLRNFTERCVRLMSYGNPNHPAGLSVQARRRCVRSSTDSFGNNRSTASSRTDDWTSPSRLITFSNTNRPNGSTARFTAISICSNSAAI